MTEADRELLKLAAKAAAYEIVSDRWARVHSDEGETLFMGNHGPAWNPLQDEGDALRLAVKLGLALDTHVSRAAYGDRIDVSENKCRDAKATRRAIVRAAAEIGKAM